MIQRINPPQLYDGAPIGMSQGSIDTSGLVFLSGQVAWDENSQVVGTSHAEQTDKALANLQVALEAANSDIHHILHVRIYVRGEVAEHMEEVVPILVRHLGEARPALTGLGVASLATPDTLVEIEAVARVRS